MKAYSIWLIEASDHKYDLNKVWRGCGMTPNPETDSKPPSWPEAQAQSESESESESESQTVRQMQIVDKDSAIKIVETWA